MKVVKSITVQFLDGEIMTGTLVSLGVDAVVIATPGFRNFIPIIQIRTLTYQYD